MVHRVQSGNHKTLFSPKIHGDVHILSSFVSYKNNFCFKTALDFQNTLPNDTKSKEYCDLIEHDITHILTKDQLK